MKKDFVYIVVIAGLMILCGMLYFNRAVINTANGVQGNASFNLHYATNQLGDIFPTNDLSIITEVVKRREFPIQYETHFAEYQIVYSHMDGTNQVISRMPIRYCPWTGTKLPESKRPGALDSALSQDVKEVQRRLRGVRTLSEVRRILGSPNAIAGPFGDVKIQWTYDRVTSAVSVIIQENENGSIDVMYVPK